MSNYEVRRERRPVTFLRHYEPNPRVIRNSKKFLALCRSIVAFGLAQTLCVLDDGRVLGGNQTLDALAQLKRGFDTARADGKGNERLQWAPLNGEVDVMLVCGATTEQAAALNLALNRHAGEDVEDEVTKVLRGLREHAPELLLAIDTQEEIDRLLADNEEPAQGSLPNAKGVPSISLQFTSAAAHMRVKQALAKGQEKRGGEEKVASGDLLDELLRAQKKPALPTNGAKKKPAASSRV